MSSSNVRVRVSGGNFLTGSSLKRAIEGAMTPAIRRAALTAQGGIQRTSPVRTGTLRRSWTTSTPSWQGSVYRVKVGTSVVYARYQDTRTRNKGYVARGLRATQAQAVRELKAGAGALRLWEADKR